MIDTPTSSATGRCLCGTVHYRIHGPLRPVISCHCSHCLRSHGHYSAYTAVGREHLDILGEEALRWYDSQDPEVKARRGFCGHCGSSLFWQSSESSLISISAGTLDRPTGLSTACHIYVADAGDYYRLGDDLPRWHQAEGQQTP
ncbi:MAG: GFA family protein [Candidatus Competibacteraceae bacterium]|nr:GFA family protein [Candidatus Competibacteraceae bacterium]